MRQPALVPVVSRSETAIASAFPTISRTQSMYQRRDQDIVTEPLLTATPLMGGGGGPSGVRQPVPIPVVSSITTVDATASSATFPRTQQSRMEQTWSLNSGSTTGLRGGGLSAADPLPNLDQTWSLQPRVGIHMMNSEPTGEASPPPRVWSPSARVQRLALSPPLRRHPSSESVSRLVGVAPSGERSDGAARLTRELAFTASSATGASDLLSVATNVPLPSAGVSRGAVLRQPVDIPATEARRSILGAFFKPDGWRHSYGVIPRVSRGSLWASSPASQHPFYGNDVAFLLWTA